MNNRAWIAGVAGVLACAGSARAIIVTGGTDAGRNLSVTAGSTEAVGWNLQGDYGLFLGTPIASNWFITATHVSNQTSSTVITTTDNVTHTIVQSVNLPGTDLTLKRVDTPFANVASIYNPLTDGPLGTVYVYGRGTARGDAIAGRGWSWGTDDHARSWGTNTVDGVEALSTAQGPFAAGTALLQADFDNGVGGDEGTLSSNDSGGAVFALVNGSLKLVGINYGVNLYGPTATGPRLNAAIYDAAGLYLSRGGVVFTPVTAVDPAAQQQWVASYVPGSLTLITATVPEPGMLGGLVGVITLLPRRRGGRGRV